MRIFAGIAVLTVGWLAVGSGEASAAWNNVFQTCCHSCGPRTSYSAPAPSGGCCPTAPAACCPTISYQQRCSYQPYTAYKQQSYYEPVTTYRTSHYWEPVTSYRYTSYYDPCTGCCQRVATPHTSYKMRSQCNAVQSYVQRCQMVPYTAYRQSCYMEPVVSYSAPPACPTPSCPTCPTPGAPSGNPGISEGNGTSPPPMADPARQPLPGVSEGNLPPQNLPNNRNRVAPPTNNIPLRMDRISSNPNGVLQGTVVADDRITPKSGTRLFFASSEQTTPKYSAQADLTGRFSVELPPGDWTLYMAGRDGKPVFHSQINVRNNDQRVVTVVSR